MFEQTFKNIDDILHKDAGCTSELDYTEQSSWLLFLKYLDALEAEKATEAVLEGRDYRFILDERFRWATWAAPKGADGKIDHNAALTGDDLRQFVNTQLFPYLAGFKQRASGPQTIEYKIGEIFGEITNKIQSGYNLRDVIDRIDELRFGSQAQKHELSHLYEAKIKNMGNAGRNGGEYYTPRPLIRAMIEVVQPQIGERIYDAACGSAGFLCEAFAYLSPKATKADDLDTLQKRTFYGKEKKSLAYVIGIMNMILHGIEAPNIVHTNTLGENINDIQERDRYDVILANPPFGGKERKEVQQNFPIKTGETAFLFMQHFIKSLRAGGRAAVVIKNTFLSNTDSASVALRKQLLTDCNLHTVLDCPGGTFQGAGVKTVVLFFTKGESTRQTWFYQLDPGRNMGKTNPLNDADLVEFVQLQKTFADSPKSWTVPASSVNLDTFDLSVKNPNRDEEVVHRSPAEILDEIAALDAEAAEVLGNIRGVVGVKAGWQSKPIGVVFKVVNGGTPKTGVAAFWDGPHAWITPAEMGNLDTPYISESRRTLTDEGLRTGAELVPAGSIILSSRAPIGHLVINEIPMAFNQGCKGLLPSPAIDTKFAYYFLLTNVPLLESLGTGATFKELSSGKLKEVLFQFPELGEQRRIVTLLDEAFADIATAKANAEKNLQNARELFESHLDAALDSHAIDHIGTTLGAEVDLVAGFAFSSSRYSNHHDDVRLLRGDNIMQGYLRWEDVKRWPKSESASHEKFALKEGDVVLAMDRPWVKAGLKRAQMVATDLPCLQVQRTARLRPKQNLRADFLFHLTGSQAFSRHLLDVQTGIGVPHISGAQIQDFKFMRPPLEKQALIASELQRLQEEIQRLESIYRQKLTALDDLKKSLLHQAFSGQL